MLRLGLFSFSSFSEESEEEAAVQPSNPQELLEIVKQGQFADTQQQREREAQFRNEKNRQAKLLSDAKDERARLEREAARLEQKFEANEALLVVAEEQLRERLGSLNEIFGHLAGNATEARNIMEQSITAAQFLQRFVSKNVPWVHLDIAGMAFSKKAANINSGGATGFGVRLLNDLVKKHYE